MKISNRYIHKTTNDKSINLFINKSAKIDIYQSINQSIKKSHDNRHLHRKHKSWEYSCHYYTGMSPKIKNK